MLQARNISGLVAGVILALSSLAHTFAGWPALSGALGAANAPADLVTGLEIGWKWGGAAMFVFGAMVVVTFGRRLRGEPAPTGHAAFIAIAYVTFGLWAFVASSRDPFFFFVFIGPGLLLGFASAGPGPIVSSRR